MPPISPIAPLFSPKFFSNSKQMPTKEWTEKFYKDRKQVAGEMTVAPKTIPPLFKPVHAMYKYHQEPADTIGKNFKDFGEAMLDAVKFAHSMWKLQAKFKDLKVMSVSAIGTPGCLDGPELESLIKNAPSCAAMMGNMQKHRDAVAKGVSKCFKDWQGQVTVPGLPWYPAFAAFPGPTAPPMPNVPMPLIACVSAKCTSIMAPMDMKSAMGDALDGGMKDKDKDKQYEALHDALATVLSLAFTCWLPAQQVMLVLGKGPIPTFAPPFVPVGPVVGGDNIAVPGHLMA
jgi:hypothetical protein